LVCGDGDRDDVLDVVWRRAVPASQSSWMRNSPPQCAHETVLHLLINVIPPGYVTNAAFVSRARNALALRPGLGVGVAVRYPQAPDMECFEPQRRSLVAAAILSFR